MRMIKRIGIAALIAALLLPCTGVAQDAAQPLWTPTQETKVIVISDIHLGIDDAFAENVQNKPALVEFLRRLQQTTDVRELVLNGDFLDDWYLPLNYPAFTDISDFYRKVITNNQDIFDELNRVIQSGIKLVYIPGNHDMLLESGLLDEALPGIVQARDSDGLGRYRTGARSEIVIEHGHRYDVFSAPDTVTNKALLGGAHTMLPPGYFYARYAASWVVQGRPRIKKGYPVIQNVPDQKADPDQFDAYLYYRMLDAEFNRITPFESITDSVFDVRIDGYNGQYAIMDMFPVVQQDGRISAPVLFQDYQRTWTERQQINDVTVPVSFAQAVAGALDSEYFFSQAKAQYLEREGDAAEVVLMGHTHKPMTRHSDAGKLYINEGTWIDHNSDYPAATRTFAVATTGETTDATLYVYGEDGSITDITESVSK